MITQNRRPEKLASDSCSLSCETLYNICEAQKLSSDYLLFGDKADEKSPKETIMEIAPDLNLKELSVVITYLDALKKMKEL